MMNTNKFGNDEDLKTIKIKGSKIDENFLAYGHPSSNNRKGIAVEFNPQSGRSTILAHIRCRFDAAIISLGKGLNMLIGGWALHNENCGVELFDCTRKLSRRLPPLNVSRWRHGACAVDGVAVVCGGNLDRNRRLKSCEVYSRIENLWKMLPEMMTVRSGVAVVALPDRRVVCIGGTGKHQEDLKSVEVCYIPTESSILTSLVSDDWTPPFWKSLAPMQIERSLPSAVYFQGKIYVAGGYNVALTYLTSVEIFTVPTDFNDPGQWYKCSSILKKPRMHFFLIVHSNMLYAIGDGFEPHNSVERIQLERVKFAEKEHAISQTPDDSVAVEWEPYFSVASIGRIEGIL